MDISNDYTNINFDTKKSETYLNKLNELNGSVNLLLDEFKQVYVMYKMYPTNEEIQQQYQNMILNIEKIQSDLFSISNNVQVDINTINTLLLQLNTLIKKEKETNTEFKKQLGIVESTNNSAYEMINDYKEIYNIKYLRNWALILSTFLCIYTISIVFKKQGV